MDTIIQLVQAIGVPMAVVLLAVLAISERLKSDNKTDNTVAEIAGTSTRELSDVYKQIGDIRQELGRAQGQNIVLMDNLKTLEQKREAEAVVTKDKIFVLQEKVEKQTVTISRHEGRIIELEKESKQKDAVIAAKEAEITELKIDNARQKVIIETQETKLANQERSIQLLNRTQSLDDTIQLTEAELLELADPVLPVPLIEAPTPATPPTETNEKKDAA